MRYSLLRKLASYRNTVALAIINALVIWGLCTLILTQLSKTLIASYLGQQKPHATYGLQTIPPPPIDDRPGQLGKPVVMPLQISNRTRRMIELDFKRNGFNQYASDLIGMYRTLPDLRHDWCKTPDRYLKNISATSIIIPIFNEPWSTLLRTINSVLINTPPGLVHEIILVDDYSHLAHLKTQLEDQYEDFPKIKILRTKKREGVTRAKLLGASHATGSVLTFLESHSEVTKGWLEPLLDRIARNPYTIAVPVVDRIQNSTFEYQSIPIESTQIVGFDWNLKVKNIDVPVREQSRRAHLSEPINSPVMFGGQFSITRKFFAKLGGYDSEFDLWGGDNVELSFKAWMCGGKLEVVPCSHVGHVFRNHNPLQFDPAVFDRNLARVAEVWMDDYAPHFYHAVHNKKIDFGDVSSRMSLKKHLKCESFAWYLKNVYPELPVPEGPLARGEVKNLARGFVSCLDSLGSMGGKVALYSCHGEKGHQFWVLTKTGEIRQGNGCLDYNGEYVLFYGCHGEKSNQLWSYSGDTKLVLHVITNKCLTADLNKKVPIMKDCDRENSHQQWVLDNYNPGSAEVKISS